MGLEMLLLYNDLLLSRSILSRLFKLVETRVE